MSPYRLVLSLIAVGLVAGLVTGLATKLVVAPEHDEFAYLANALYWSGLHSASGMTFGPETYSVTFTERPPLFWWLLTSIFALGANPFTAIIISPLFTALNAIIVTLFAYELAGELKYGIFAGILAAVSGFGANVGSHILSDATGSFFAALAMYSFYQYFFKDRRPFALLLGASIGLGLVARDEDLITLILLIILWILFVPKVSLRKKMICLLVFAIIFGGPVKFWGLIGTMQLVSNIATPLVFDGWPFVVAAGFFIAYLAFTSKTRTRLAELGSAFFVFFLVMLPFFFDNYTLGNIDYYIAGKGVLARPVSHLMMIPQTADVGASLPTFVRASAWLYSTPALLSIPIIIFAIVGGFYLFRYQKKNFAFLFLWTVISFGYVVGTTNLEDRFLLIAFAPVMIFAGIGLGYIWKKDYFIGIIFAAISIPLSDTIPRTPISISDLTVVSGLTSQSQNWMYTFLSSVTLGSAKPILSLPLLVEGLLSLPVAIVAISLGTYFAVTGPRITPCLEKNLAAKLSMPQIHQDRITQSTRDKSVINLDQQEDDDIEIIEGKSAPHQESFDAKEDEDRESYRRPPLHSTWSFADSDDTQEELGWLFSDQGPSLDQKEKTRNNDNSED